MQRTMTRLNLFDFKWAAFDAAFLSASCASFSVLWARGRGGAEYSLSYAEFWVTR
jgi:hypothetical protein